MLKMTLSIMSVVELERLGEVMLPVESSGAFQKRG